MIKKWWWYVAVVVVLPLNIVQSAGAVNPSGFTIDNWLIFGAFASAGSNSFYQNFLPQPENTFSLPPEDSLPDIAEKSLQWVEVVPDEKGFTDLSQASRPISGKQIVYAYTTLASPIERTAVFTFGHSGSIEVWLNGKSLHFNRISRKPEPDRDVVVVTLEKGQNKILVKCEGTPPYLGFYHRVYYPVGKVYINASSTIIPDFRVGYRVAGWGQVEVANVSGDSLRNIAVKVTGNHFIVPTVSSDDGRGMAAGEVRRIPFWLESRSEILDSTVAAVEINILDQSTVITPRLRQRNEYFVTTYRSMLDGSVQPYSLLVPTSYRASEAYPLIVLLHGAWVTGWGQNMISYGQKEWAIQVAVHDRGNNRYRDIGEVDLNEVLYHVKQQFHIDEDRIFLSGHSMGGYGTWFQAVRYPDRWASISPQAGYADYFLYHPAMMNSSDSTSYRRQLLTEWSPLAFAENLLHVPAYIIHGAKDDNVVVEHSRKMAARLKQLGYNYIYDENPDAGHWWGPRGKFYGVEVVDKPPIWSFFQKNMRRVKKPERVVYKTNTLRYNRAYWVTIDELDSIYKMAGISAQFMPDHRLDIHTENITQFSLDLQSAPIDSDKLLHVYINSRPVFSDEIPTNRKLAFRKENHRLVALFYPEIMPANDPLLQEPVQLAAYINDAGKIQEIQSRSPGQFKKSSEVFGPVVDAFNRPFLFVIGTQSNDPALNQAIRLSALRIAKTWASMAEGRVDVKFDFELSNEDIIKKNLILFGNQSGNAFLSRITGRLPIQVFADTVRFGKHFMVGPDIGSVFVYPNPLNRQRYIVLIAGTTPHSYHLATRLHLPELPDFVVFDKASFESPEMEFRRAGFFDKYWQLPAPAKGDEKK